MTLSHLATGPGLQLTGLLSRRADDSSHFWNISLEQGNDASSSHLRDISFQGKDSQVLGVMENCHLCDTATGQIFTLSTDGASLACSLVSPGTEACCFFHPPPPGRL